MPSGGQIAGIGLAVLAAGLVGWGAKLALDKRADTIKGIESSEGKADDVSPGFAASTGPLYIFVGAGQDDVACQDVFETLALTLVPTRTPQGVGKNMSNFNFSYTEFTPTGPTGKMTLKKDCVKGSLGGYYSGVTVAATMEYASCTDSDCTWIFQDYPIVSFGWDMEYTMVSDHKVFGIAGVLIRKALNETLKNVWDVGGTYFIAGMVLAVLSVVSCVFGRSGSDDAEPGLVEVS